MTILQLLLIAACAVASSLACSCMPAHPQKQFCDAHYVIRAYVISKTEQPHMQFTEKVYTLIVRETFKSQANVKTDQAYEVKLYTPPDGFSCGVRLQIQQEYLLFGKILQGKLFHGFCDWHKKWTDLTKEQLLGIKSRYSSGCVCSMGFCFTSKCRNLLPGCEGYDRNVDHDCREKYQHCESQISPRGETVCSWVGSRMCKKSIFFP